MITTVSCGLSLQLTRKLVNLSTRQLQIMITDVSCGLLLQLTRQPVNSSTTHIIKFNVQTSKFKGKSSENKKRNTLPSIPFVIPTGFKPVTS